MIVKVLPSKTIEGIAHKDEEVLEVIKALVLVVSEATLQQEILNALYDTDKFVLFHEKLVYFICFCERSI